MNSATNLEALADLLRQNGYDVEPDEAFLTDAANRLRNAGYKVTDKRDKRDDDTEVTPAGDGDQAATGARSGRAQTAKKSPAGSAPPQETQGVAPQGLKPSTN